MCAHPPAKHLKLDPVSQTGRLQFSAGHSSTSQAPFQPAQPTYVPVQQPQYPSYLASLKDCAAGGCSKKVHYDHELGPFDYCSPECRDRHLLPSEREKLKKDVEDYSMKMATYYPPSSSSASAATDDDDKILLTIEKRPKEQLGIITADIRGERGLRIVGVEFGTPAHHKLKEGKIKLLDIITQLNEDDVASGDLFQQSTRDKTRPILTLMRNHKAPSMKNLLSKVKDKCKSATHIRVLINPFHQQIKCGLKNFGFDPAETKGPIGFVLGVREEDSSSAHLSGVTLRDEALMYAVMSRRQIGEGNIPSTTAEFQQDISKALNDGKHLILVLM
jgi:hypothetical protein